jgi:hypothetical protein
VPNALIAWPIATGVFFGVVTMLLVRWGAGNAEALVIGVLVGLAMFTVNAIALSLLHGPPRGEVRVED